MGVYTTALMNLGCILVYVANWAGAFNADAKRTNCRVSYQMMSQDPIQSIVNGEWDKNKIVLQWEAEMLVSEMRLYAFYQILYLMYAGLTYSKVNFKMQ